MFENGQKVYAYLLLQIPKVYNSKMLHLPIVAVIEGKNSTFGFVKPLEGIKRDIIGTIV